MSGIENCLTSPVDVKKVANMIQEMVNSLVREQAEKDFRKDVCQRLKDEYDLSTAESNKAARVVLKGTGEFDKTVEAEERRQHFIDQLFHALKERPMENENE